MNNIRKIVILIFITLIFILTIFLVFKKDSPIEYKTEIKNDISVLIYDSSEEEYVYHNNIPVGDYIVNRTLSKCLGGGIIDEYDNENGTVIFYTDGSDKCTLYFDLKPTNALMLSNAAGFSTTVVNNMLRFSGTFQDSNSDGYSTDADYAGVVDNYICLGSTASPCPADNLYRIVGVVAADDDTLGLKKDMIKVMKNDPIGQYTWDGGTLTSSNYTSYRSHCDLTENDMDVTTTDPSTGCFPTWQQNNLNTTILNQTYLNSLSFKNDITAVKWRCYMGDANRPTPAQEMASDICSSTPSKIGLIYMTDYYNSYDNGTTMPTSNKRPWIVQCTKSTNSGNSTNFIRVCYQYIMGNQGYLFDSYFPTNDWKAFAIFTTGSYGGTTYASIDSNTFKTYANSIRPAFYLNESLLISSGTGTASDPFRF